ncbi:MAG: TetR/AcrR family transcriptional regulator [Bacteroidales bacterium]|nr:TetR/AcrR family transcriptional regulator [Bacteroidales bacterium]
MINSGSSRDGAAPDLGPRALQTRQKILDTALALIIDHGESGVTITDICDAVAISRTTMYRHFAGMDDIIRGVYLNVRERFASGLEAAIARNPDKQQRLDVVVDYLYQFFKEGLSLKLGQTDPKFLRELSLANFDSRVELYKAALDPFFEQVEQFTGKPVDRHLVGYFITHFYASLSVYGAYAKPYEIDVLLRKLIVGLTYLNQNAPTQ